MIFNIFTQTKFIMKRLKGIEIIDIIAFLITLIIFILAVGGSISGYVRPHHFKWLAIANNLLPITIISSIVLMLFWLIRRSWGFLLPLFSIIINTYTLLSIFQFRGEKEIIAYNNQDIIKVINYNIHEFRHLSGYEGAANIAEFIKEEAPDILSLQEYKNATHLNSNEMKGFFDHIPHKYIVYPDDNHLGLAIMSKYKIIRKGKIDFEDSANRVIWADLSTDRGLIRVINFHLQTTSFALQRERDEDLFKSISQIKHNNEMRAIQAEEVKLLADTTAHPIIICGDMNDTPSSYAYTKIKVEKVADGFREAGSKMGGTYRGMFGLFRIDYIFHSTEFKSVRYTTPDKEWSDHKPVISELVYQN